jgi:hypothetical protein
MNFTRAAVPVLAALSAISAVRPLPAQIQAGATAGVVVPMIDPLVRELGGVNGSPVLYPVLEKWHVGGAAFTARAVLRGKGKFDIEGALLFSPSLIASRDSFNVVRDISAALWVASLRVPIVFSNRANSVWFYAAPGLSYSLRTGNAWSGFSGTKGLGGVINLGSRARVKRRSNLWFQVGVENYFGWGRLSRGSELYEPQFHHLPVFSVGMLYQFGGRQAPSQ